MIPTVSGKPFYFDGFPVRASNIYCKGTQMDKIKMKYLEREATKEEEEELKEYVLYYITAPCFQFQFDSPEQEENFKTKMTLDNMLDLLLDSGIDPL